MVPGPWQAQFEDLRLWWGTAWYERGFRTDPRWSGRRVRICFGAVDYFCNVWLNGAFAGRHEGGYLPFDVDVTEFLHSADDNSVVVEVRDPGREESSGSAAPFRFEEIPHGKQSWYGPVGGLWQSVFIEATAQSFIRSARVWPDNSGRVRVDVRLDAATEPDGELTCDVAGPGGSVATSAQQVGANSIAMLEFEVEHPRLWGPDEPNLYELRLQIENRAGTSDAWSDSFGFRRISVADGLIVLNGKPIFVRGALDQDYYPETIYTPPSEKYLYDEMKAAKRMGLNLVRCHIKVPDPRYVRVADRLGVLLWAELPNWAVLTEGARKRARATFEGMVDRDFNRPSIVIWSLVNESWGIDLNDPEQRAWLADMYSWAKELDPTRLVVDNSACPPNFHLESDLNDFHLYRALPDHEHEWDAWTAGWTANPASTYGSCEGTKIGGGEPLVLSEFGNWGLPDMEKLLTEGREPWWFETGTEWGNGSVIPHGASDRFNAWSLGEVFGSWQGLAAASQGNQFEALRHEIQDLRSHREIAGYVITEFTDVLWESNGLLDFARNRKTFDGRLHEINASDVLIARPPARRIWSGDAAQIDVMMSRFSDHDLHDCAVEWSGVGIETGVQEVGRIAPRTLSALCKVVVNLPRVEVPAPFRVDVRLHTRGRTHAETSIDLVVCPRPQTDDPYVRVVEELDATTESLVRGGAPAVVVATDEEALARVPALRVRHRRGTVWEGDWAQGLHWLRPEFVGEARLGPAISSPWAGLVPEHVVLGYRPVHALDILSGYFVGWLHHIVATTGKFRCGAGLVVVTTFPVLESYGRDPLATWFLNRLVDIAADRKLTSRMQL
jgi:Glycosyl hydrolases family 2, sugar binding domain/Glycosyl hydrolases family 2, TIM barrel domain/Glycosyl hydrolases family 2